MNVGIHGVSVHACMPCMPCCVSPAVSTGTAVRVVVVPKGLSAPQSLYGCVGRLVRSHPCECYVQKMQCSLQCAHVQGYGNQATGHKHARHVPDLGEVICVFLTHFLLPVFACTVSPPRSWSAVMTAWALNCVSGSRGW